MKRVIVLLIIAGVFAGNAYAQGIGEQQPEAGSQQRNERRERVSPPQQRENLTDTQRGPSQNRRIAPALERCQNQKRMQYNNQRGNERHGRPNFQRYNHNQGRRPIQVICRCSCGN